jgi:hypothetical protein
MSRCIVRHCFNVMYKKIVIACVAFFASVRSAFATPGPGPGVGGITPYGPSSFEAVIQAVLDAIVQIGTLAIAIMIVWSGFLFVTSAGDTTKLTTARKAFFWALIGGAIILGAKAIELAIRDTIPTI